MSWHGVNGRFTAKTRGPSQPSGRAVGTALAGQLAVLCTGTWVAVTGWHLAASPPRFLQGSETSPVGSLEGSTPHGWTSWLAPGEAGTSLPPSPKPAPSAPGDGSHGWALTHRGHAAHALLCPQSPEPGSPMKEVAVGLGSPSQFSRPCPTLWVSPVWTGGPPWVTITSGQRDLLPGCPLSEGTGLRLFQEQKVSSAQLTPGARCPRDREATLDLTENSDQTPG